MSAFADVAAVVQSEPLADDLTRQVQGCRVVVQHEFGVGAQEDRVQLEREPVGVFPGGKLVLVQRGGREAPEQRGEPGLDGGDPVPGRTGTGSASPAP